MLVYQRAVVTAPPAAARASSVCKWASICVAASESFRPL